VYRLTCCETTIIAKCCATRIVELERQIYGTILPRLDVETLSVVGSSTVDVRDTGWSWIFLEDAGEDSFVRLNVEHQELALKWIGIVHSRATKLVDQFELPATGPDHYFSELVSGRRRISECLRIEALPGEDRLLLLEIVEILDTCKKLWPELTRDIAQLPRTLVHGDFVCKNIRLGGRGDRVAVRVLDWETGGWGPQGVDFAAIVGSLPIPVEARVGCCADLLSTSFPDLNAGTIASIARASMVFRLVTSVSWAAAGLEYEDSRSRALRHLATHKTALESIGLC
jgi:hypothetical protein